MARPRVLMVAVSLVLAACSTTKGDTSRTLVPHAEYIYDFNSLPEMVATSSVVIEGTVRSISPGAITGGKCTDQQEAANICEGDGAIQYTDVDVSVDHVLAGRLSGDGSTVTIVEYPTVELPLTTNEAHGFFFLFFGKNDGYFSLINPEGRFLVDGGGTLSSSQEYPDPWVTRIEAETQAEFRREIRDAAAAVAGGSVSL